MHVLVVDDEKKARETIVGIIKLYYPSITHIYEAESVQAAVTLLSRVTPDLLLLDIRLNDGSGFDVLRQTAPRSFNVIFITAYESYAIQAFRVSALDYLLKPIDPDELVEAIRRAQQKTETDRLSERIELLLQQVQPKAPDLKRITLKTTESIHIVNIADIIYCESARNYTTFFLLDKRKIVVSRTLGEYEEILPQDIFLRVHQSFLINLHHVIRYEKGDGGFLVTTLGGSIPVSTRKKEQLMQFLQKL